MCLFMKSKPIDVAGRLIAAALLLLVSGGFERALGAFAVRVSPPNFEFYAKAGQTIRDSILIENVDKNTGFYQIRTADWEINPEGGVIIHPQDQVLEATSCRPWTRIERRSLTLSPNRTKRYRFEVHVPEGAADGECRFAMVIAPDASTIDTMNMGTLKVPVLGSIAVIVYVTVGDARPDIQLVGVKRADVKGVQLPMIRLYNQGNAHARPYGSMTVRDAENKSAELLVVPFPILPGETRDIKLAVDDTLSGIANIEELMFPISLKGTIEWYGGMTKIDATIQ